MLEFVHVSGPEAGKDLQTRRKVRSQAMRDFRRRQREEKGKNDGGVPASKTTTKSRKAAPGASKQGSPRIQTSRSRATSTTSSASRASNSRAASMTSSTPWIPSIEQATPDGSLSVPTTRTTSAPTYGHAFDSNPAHSYIHPQLIPEHTPEWPIPEHMYLTPDWMLQPTSTTSRSPSVWASDTEDYFQHPGHTPRTPQGFSFCHCCAAATLNPVLCDVCTQATYDNQFALATTWH
ncbi:hypothetical protein LTR35_002986 [Friedmanniomyces endolithicus]|uniref:Uncharacterized protein n=1 Tax=Friedmanniomyces endolithicus TaxID=329885 RepID=A0AAN6FC92_9PEZI|nr:hypothetical protein LTS00_012368 [Friedmanniomyces endolithicus]KAK0289787.1 hypothetical protein LTR35_002986 [Friedmanniomyces endolithicus]KAK0312294.1 hypothetical protein LTR82_014091 [Friedmanniomyces endolithicus]KAK1019866.1 hypothetical protein LTR54_000510 [Friedmanniomyces endolithicus]